MSAVFSSLNHLLRCPTAPLYHIKSSSSWLKEHLFIDNLCVCCQLLGCRRAGRRCQKRLRRWKTEKRNVYTASINLCGAAAAEGLLNIASSTNRKWIDKKKIRSKSEPVLSNGIFQMKVFNWIDLVMSRVSVENVYTGSCWKPTNLLEATDITSRNCPV